MFPVSPELAQVFSRIVLRHTNTAEALSDESSPPTVPLVARWMNTSVCTARHSPTLFQRGFLIGRRGVISSGTVLNWLIAAAADARSATTVAHDSRSARTTFDASS